jgi:hypothetical protein
MGIVIGKLPPEAGQSASVPAAPLDPRKGGVDFDINKGAREAANAPIPAPAIPFHPYADIFPIGCDEALEALAADIAEHEQLDPITMYDGKILDGRRRYLACQQRGIEPKFQYYEGNDPLDYVISRNAHRRHLSESQRAMVGGRLSNLRLGANQHSEGVAIATASVRLSISRDSICRARKVLVCGIPELIKAVDENRVSVSKAYRIAKLPQSEQRAAVDHVAGSEPPAEGGASQTALTAELTEAELEASASDNAICSTGAQPDPEAPATIQAERGLEGSSSSMPAATRSRGIRQEREKASHRGRGHKKGKIRQVEPRSSASDDTAETVAPPAIDSPAATMPEAGSDDDGAAEMERLKLELAEKTEKLRQIEDELRQARIAASRASERLVTSPPSAPTHGDDDLDIPPFLDRRPLSTEEEETLAALLAVWDRDLKKRVAAATAIIRERFFTAIRRTVTDEHDSPATGTKP